MKAITLFLSVLFLLFGCATVQEYVAGIDEDAAIVVSSRILAREIGCEVAFSEDPEIDRAMRNIYDLAEAGKLTEDAMNQLNDALSKHIGKRPTLVPSIIDLMELAGVRFNPEGLAIGLGEVSPKLFEAVSTGYTSGFNVCQYSLKAGYSYNEIIAMEKAHKKTLQRYYGLK